MVFQVSKKYLSVARLMKQYEDKKFELWREQVETHLLSYLKRNLLSRSTGAQPRRDPEVMRRRMMLAPKMITGRHFPVSVFKIDLLMQAVDLVDASLSSSCIKRVGFIKSVKIRFDAT